VNALQLQIEGLAEDLRRQRQVSLYLTGGLFALAISLIAALLNAF
jgi:hypothetical protein